MAELAAWIEALRTSHDRFGSLVSPLDDAAVRAASYDDGWSIAQVASHLGSQAEIFTMILDAGLAGHAPPGPEQFGPIWQRWDGLAPGEQVTASVHADEQLVSRLERLPQADRDRFVVSVFGADRDLSGIAAMRLGEHAVHTWDIAVALDPAAVVLSDAVALLMETLPETAKRVGKASGPARTVLVETAAPQRRFALTTGPEVAIVPAGRSEAAELSLPAEAFLRLVFGRLDPAHTPAGLSADPVLAELRPIFPGV